MLHIDDELDRDAVVYVVHQAIQSKARSSIKKQLKKLIADEAAHAIVGELWVTHVAGDPGKYAREISRMATEGMQRSALQYILEGWPSSTAATPVNILKITEKFRNVLRSENDLWAMTGFVLLRLYEKPVPRHAIDWMKDWKARENVDATHLFVLAEALMADDQMDEAVEVADIAKACPDAATHVSLRLFLLWYKSETIGSLDRGRRELSSLNRNHLTVEAQCLYDLVDARVNIAEAETEAQRIQITRQSIRALKKTYLVGVTGRIYGQCAKRTIQALRKTLPLRYRMGKAIWIAVFIAAVAVRYFLSRD